jgi:alpha/beta hydrolase fold
MKQSKKMATAILILLLSFSCSKDDKQSSLTFTQSQISLPTHKLTAYSIIQNSKYLVVFEAGLGDDHSVWNEKNIPTLIHSKSDVVLYDRAGYGKSEVGPAPRNINRLSMELESVVNQFSNGRKVILVGHSLGGMIIRDYAIKNPSKIAGLLFVDPSHENYNQPTQADEDLIHNYFSSNYGATFGGTLEARELIEDSQYTSTLPNLPNIPVIVISSMKVDADHSMSDRQVWYDAHEMLKNGVTDFTHIATTISGHYIMNDEPNIILEHINLLLSKLP